MQNPTKLSTYSKKYQYHPLGIMCYSTSGKQFDPYLVGVMLNVIEDDAFFSDEK